MTNESTTSADEDPEMWLRALENDSKPTSFQTIVSKITNELHTF